MITDTEKELENIFISYKRALEKLKLLNVRTKSNKEITHKDLRYAVDFMNKKHPSCRWKCQRQQKEKHYILVEGFYWLRFVYFKTDIKIIDADIEFFEKRIKLYEDFLEVDSKKLFENDMYMEELEKYFNRKHETVKKAITKMLKSNTQNYRYIENGKCKISKEGIEWLCKNCFKQKYLQLLEEYKMELTEKYIEKGYPYDIF